MDSEKLLKRWLNAHWLTYKIAEKIACEDFNTVKRLLENLQKIIRKTKQDLKNMERDQNA